MHVFLSHVSKSKPIIREVRQFLPHHIKIWLDENDILIGEHFPGTIEQAIPSCDFLLAVLDIDCHKSEWVKKELQWGLEHESKIGRPFILPVILDKRVLKYNLPIDLLNRNYIQCYDFKQGSVEKLATDISKSLFAILSEAKEHFKKPGNATFNSIDSADKLMSVFADDIRNITFSHNKDNPLSFEGLFLQISKTEHYTSLTREQFLDIINRLQQQNYLCGIIFDGDKIYIEEAHIAWKASQYSLAKSEIAKIAVGFIKSNDIVFIDAGSTTLELAKEIGKCLKRKNLKNLKIATNSLSAANEILQVCANLGWDDFSSNLTIYIIGGRIRINTLATVGSFDDTYESSGQNTFKHIAEVLGRNADIAFIGINGVHMEKGFSTHNNIELLAKADLLAYANRRILLADPSKFDIKKEITIAGFDDDVEVITASGYNETLKKYIEFFKSTKARLITA